MHRTTASLPRRILSWASAVVLLGAAACSGISAIPPGTQPSEAPPPNSQSDGSGTSATPNLGSDSRPAAGQAPCTGPTCGGAGGDSSELDAGMSATVIVEPPTEDSGTGPCDGGPCESVAPHPPPPPVASVPDDAGSDDGAPDARAVGGPRSPDAGKEDAGRRLPIGPVIGVAPFPGDAGLAGPHLPCFGPLCGLLPRPGRGGVFGP